MRAYSEKDITHFDSDLAKIRFRPSLYIGELGTTGVFTILREAADNGVDENRAGRNPVVYVSYDKTKNEIVVADLGVGIPVKIHPKAKISTLTHVLTSIQASGKSSESGGGPYDSSIGVHGVGIKASNALSSKFEVWTYRNDAGGWHYTAFEKGVEKTPVTKKCPALPIPNWKHGTIIRFTPDQSIFGGKLQWPSVVDWAKITSYLNPSLKIVLSSGGKTVEYHHKGGIADLMATNLKKLELETVGSPILLSSDMYDLAFAYTSGQELLMDWYTNTVYNVDGGFHADTFFKALMDSLVPYAGRKGFKMQDLKPGIVGILNLRINSPKFSSQTKGKLVDDRAKQPLYDDLFPALQTWWSKHKTQAKEICSRAADYGAIMLEAKASAKAARQIKSSSRSKTLLPGKLAQVDCSTEEREVFLLEGGSASGSAKSARFKEFQEILDLKGKIINACRKSKSAVLASEEVQNIFIATGIDPSKPDPTANMRCSRIILLTDPDPDGGHISSLVLALLWEMSPQVFAKGKVFAVAASEFTAIYKGNRIFANSLSELKTKCGGTLPKETSHLKGWGELDPEPLREMAFRPGSRRLYRITQPSSKDAKTFELIMSDDPAYRKELLGVD